LGGESATIPYLLGMSHVPLGHVRYLVPDMA